MALLAYFLHCLIIVFPQTYEVDIPRPCNRWENLAFTSAPGVRILVQIVVSLTRFITLQIGGWNVLCWEKVKVSRESVP